MCRACDCASCSPTCRRPRNIFRQGSRRATGASSCFSASRRRAQTIRRAHPHHLAGGRAAVSVVARTRSAGRHRAPDRRGPRADDRRRPRRSCARQSRPASSTAFTSSGGAAVLSPPTTSLILVPFGEYRAARRVSWARSESTSWSTSPADFAAGPGPAHLRGARCAADVGPLICYEILFPGEVTAGRPGWLVNVTDDSWFGPPASTGPQQHFLAARVRAIEEGLPVARAANTGISAVIDPLGRVVASLGCRQDGRGRCALARGGAGHDIIIDSGIRGSGCLCAGLS